MHLATLIITPQQTVLNIWLSLPAVSRWSWYKGSAAGNAGWRWQKYRGDCLLRSVIIVIYCIALFRFVVIINYLHPPFFSWNMPSLRVLWILRHNEFEPRYLRRRRVERAGAVSDVWCRWQQNSCISILPLPPSPSHQRDMCLAEEGSVVPRSAAPRHSRPRYGDSVKYCGECTQIFKGLRLYWLINRSGAARRRMW